MEGLTEIAGIDQHILSIDVIDFRGMFQAKYQADT